MKKINKFIKSFLFISIWLIFISYLERYWNLFHWEYVLLKVRFIFDYEFWDVIKKILFGFDFSYYLEELFRFLSFELPKEAFKYLPIYFYLNYIWKSNQIKK
mgnify:CR=1 FL=1|tara:strand:+ start:167 stop:472 length:306 start_codon:yes stop_codon:yes gene_type:complete